MFFHYQPSYFHLHVHSKFYSILICISLVINIKYEAPGFNPTSIFLETVINNIKLIPSYYQKSTLLFIRKITDPLYLKFYEAGRI